MLEAPVAAEMTSPLSRASSFIGLLFDRILPALLFGLLVTSQGVALVNGAQRWPAEPGLAVWSVHLLHLAHRALSFLFLGLITVLLLVRRTPRGKRARPVAMTVAFLGTFIMFLAAGQPVSTQDWRLLVAANLLMVAGLAFSVYSAASLRYCFGLAPEARGLVTTGAYRLVRHPLYLGELVTIVGLMLPVLSTRTLLIFAVFCVLQTARAIMEERVLASTFAEYEEYRRRTPALLPWPRP